VEVSGRGVKLPTPDSMNLLNGSSVLDFVGGLVEAVRRGDCINCMGVTTP